MSSLPTHPDFSKTRYSSERHGHASCVYALVDPRLGVPRYIGSTIDFLGRFRQHIGKGWHGSLRLMAWCRELRAINLTPLPYCLEIVPCKEEDDDQAWTRNRLEREAAWISAGRVWGWPLLNRWPHPVGIPTKSHRRVLIYDAS